MQGFLTSKIQSSLIYLLILYFKYNIISLAFKRVFWRCYELITKF
nr:MAG TPA: hypothetical protein [Caudoviricetes sp.]